MELRERDIEKYLVKKVKEAGGEVRKLKWIGRRGAPDRVVFLNGTTFVELKAPGKKLEAHQKREHERMLLRDVRVVTLADIEAVDWWVEWRARAYG